MSALIINTRKCQLTANNYNTLKARSNIKEYYINIDSNKLRDIMINMHFKYTTSVW